MASPTSDALRLMTTHAFDQLAIKLEDFQNPLQVWLFFKMTK
jgi:hypothetical protein